MFPAKHLEQNLVLNYRYVSQYHAMPYKLDFLILSSWNVCREESKGWKGTVVRQPSLDNLRIQFNSSKKKSGASI